MDILKFYQDYNITFKTEGHKHCRPGWVNVECPFCFGNFGYHLSYNLQDNFFLCWRCGSHSIKETIGKLLNIDPQETYQIIKNYGGYTTYTTSPKVTIRKKAHKMPSGVGPMTKRHKQYLFDRGFDPDTLEHDWGLLGTGPVSELDGMSYSHRIIIPIYWKGQQVTFQGRDITGKHMRKYLACPADRELENIKHIIYGKPEYWGGIGICVEGVTDVWRLGPFSFCVFGIKFTPTQVRVIAKNFTAVAVMFDDDPQAQEEAKKLVAELKFRGIRAENIPIVGDPGSLSQEHANKLVDNILKNF
jgi:hypothetical protein